VRDLKCSEDGEVDNTTPISLCCSRVGLGL
jgi:hypothetical protein